jgi:ubiquinol-cytochrome c reductase cytochrome c subunit
MWLRNRAEEIELKQAVSNRRTAGILPLERGVARFIILLAVVALAVMVPRRAGTQASSGNAKNGKQIYTSYGCYECHGREGQGSILSGPRIGPHPTQFSAFVKYIRQPKGQMPPYTDKVISDAELADIYAFLQSLPQPPDPRSIPLLNSESGAKKSR